MFSWLLLIIGYILAVPPLFGIKPALRRPAAPMTHLGLTWPWRVANSAEVIGALMIAAGWLGRGNSVATVINASWAVIFGGLWLRAERKTKI